MKIMTCTQLGGACDKAFKGENFEDIIEQSKQHGMEMFMAGDAIHLEAIGEMQKLMQTPQAMQSWFEGKKKMFEDLPQE
jgi:hypothetical protein|tara:strand:- start:300 stop:536 length:237 start_codon:yes stop_codon:yes gene_type:complete